MPTNTTEKRFAGLDHLRALAILLVFIYHFGLFGHPAWVETVGGFGWTGVDLFFVLSGYLIGGQLLGRVAQGRPLALGEFYFKRLLRIVPAYLAVLAVYFAIPAFKERSELPPLWRFLTFTQNFGLDAHTSGAFSHAWSLCVEEQFYLLLPLILLVMLALRAGRWMLWLLPALFGLGLFLRIYSWDLFIAPMLSRGIETGLGVTYYKWIYYPSYTRMDGLLAGVGLAALCHFQPGLWSRLTRHGNAWLLLALALLGGAYFLCADLITFSATAFGYPLVDAGYAVLVLAALSPGCLLYRFDSRLTAWIAAISYSLYLVHKPLIHLTQVVLGGYGFNADGNAVFLAASVVAVLGGWALHLGVERPALRLRDRLLKRTARGRVRQDAHGDQRPASLDLERRAR